MKENNNIEELFRQGFENLEADVNPQVWNNIASGLKTAAPVSGTVSGIKAVSSVYWIAGTIAVAVISTVSVLLYNNETKTEKQITPIQNEKVATENNLPKSVSTNKTPVATEIASSSSINTEHLKGNKSIEPQKSSESKLTQSATSAELEKSSNKSEKETVVNNEAPKSESSNIVSNQVNNSNQTEQTPNEQIESNQNSVPPVIAAKSVEPDMESYFGALPNSFSPNGDNQNDLFMVHPNNVKSFSVTIFDRSGKVIHHWTSPNGFWDGLMKNGSQAPSGAYIYSIIGESETGLPLKKQGTITIFR